MDVLFVGLGSIGTRHLKNLHAAAARRARGARSCGSSLSPRMMGPLEMSGKKLTNSAKLQALGSAAYFLWYTSMA